MCLVNGKCCAGREGRAGEGVLPAKNIQYCAAAAGLGSRGGPRVSPTRRFLHEDALESLEHPQPSGLAAAGSSRGFGAVFPGGRWSHTRRNSPAAPEAAAEIPLAPERGSGCLNEPANSLINEVELSHCTKLGNTSQFQQQSPNSLQFPCANPGGVIPLPKPWEHLPIPAAMPRFPQI